MSMLPRGAQTLARVREKKPLVHHLTNFVTVNDCANMTLAAGASPVMANDPAEVESMVALADALVINIGALNSQLVDSMIAAGKKAAGMGIPVIFDPVGVGATSLRMRTAERIIQEVRPTVIRGNMSEIKALSGLNAGSRGVDSVADETDGEIVAGALAQKLGCVIAVTGKTDTVADGNGICRIANGHALLAGVSGTGCMATSLTACCCAVADDSFIGTVTGIMIMGIAGEIAQQALRPGEGLGSFRMRLFDAVANLTPAMMLQYGRISAALT